MGVLYVRANNNILDALAVVWLKNKLMMEAWNDTLTIPGVVSVGDLPTWSK